MKPDPALRRPAPQPKTGPRRRPMAETRRIALFEREVREHLSRAALDLVLARAQVLGEGQRISRRGQRLFEGSVMLTIDLHALSPLLREPCDAGTARKLAQLFGKDAGFGARLRAIATREVARIVAERPAQVSTEVKITTRGATVLVDVDVEAVLR